MEFMGHADLPQQAKHNASVQALPYLNQMPDIKPPSKAAAIPKNSQSKKETETASMTKEGKNVIMVLNEIAMQQQVCIDWNIVDEDGPPHMRAFTYTLKMGSYEVSFLYLLFKCDMLALALLRIEIVFLPSCLETKLPQNLDKSINSLLISTK